MTTTQSPTAGFLGNPAREARAIEREVVRRLGLLGIRADDGAAIRQLLAPPGTGNGRHLPESMVADLLGLGLLLLRLQHRSSAAGDKLRLEPVSRAFVDALLGATSGGRRPA